MLPTPKPISDNPSITSASLQPRDEKGRFVSTAAPDSKTKDKWVFQTLVGIQGVLAAQVKIAESLEKVVENTAHIAAGIDSMLDFFRDQKIQNEQNAEAKRLRPKNDNSGNSGNDSNWLTEQVEGLLGSFFIKTAIVGLVAVLTSVSEEIRKKSMEIISTYLVFARKETLTALEALGKTFIDSINAIGKFFGEGILKYLDKAILAIGQDKILVAFEKVGSVIGKIIRPFVFAVQDLANSKVFEVLAKTFEILYKVSKGIVEVVWKVIDVFLKPAFSLFEEFGSTAVKSLGFVKTFLGKVLLPVQVIMSLIDFVGGFMEGYEKGGALEGVKQGLLAVFDGFFKGIVNIVSGVVTWVLNKLGLEETAKEFQKTIDDVYNDIRNVLSSIIDIFAGLVTLDGKKIWEGIKSGYSSFYDLIVDSVGGMFRMIVDFIKDLFGDKVKAALDYIQKDLVNDIVDLATSFKDAIVGWIKDAFHSILENTVGKETADRWTGRTPASPEEIEKKAQELARDKYASKLDPMTRGQMIGNTKPSDFADKVTDEDRAEAKRQLNVNVQVSPADNPVAARQVDQMKNVQNEKSGETKGNTTQTNVVQQNINNGKSGPTIILGTSNSASKSNPMNR